MHWLLYIGTLGLSGLGLRLAREEDAAAGKKPRPSRSSSISSECESSAGLKAGDDTAKYYLVAIFHYCTVCMLSIVML